MSETQTYQVEHNPSASRFEVRLENHLAVLDYRKMDDTILFTHTGVPSALEGRGIGSALVRTGLDYARQQSLKVASMCSFVDAFIRRKPEYQDLLK